ncbi:MAG: GatB/YqeY domain-containing protein [Pseudomonadota bacterium]
MRERIKEAVKDAMRAKDSVRLSTLRLMSAALKDQDIARRADDDAKELGAQEITALFAKMVKQREDSIKAYEEAGRMELAEQERAEQVIIREFLPKQLSETEIEAAITKAIADTGAESLRDMGKVMGALKAAYAGQMDFGAAGGKLKAILG